MEAFQMPSRTVPGTGVPPGSSVTRTGGRSPRIAVKNKANDCGLFTPRVTVAYKFTLLLALADLSIEHGDDSGAALQLTTDAIAEKFVQYY